MVSIAILVMIPNIDEFEVITVQLPGNATLQEVGDFLVTNQKISFKRYFFTNKLAQMSHFTMNKTIDEIKPQCQLHAGNYLLLCYENTLLEDSKLQTSPKPSLFPKNKYNNRTCCIIY